jgi:hypothetical protein
LPRFAFVAQELDARTVGQALHLGGGGILGRVVDDDDLERARIARREPVAQGDHGVGNAALLVVGGHDHGHPRGVHAGDCKEVPGR